MAFQEYRFQLLYHILFLKNVQNEAIRDEHVHNSKKMFIIVSLVSKQKVHISVSENLHFINFSLVYKDLRLLILYWNAWSFVLSNVSKCIECTILQSSCKIVFPNFCCHFSFDCIVCSNTLKKSLWIGLHGFTQQFNSATNLSIIDSNLWRPTISSFHFCHIAYQTSVF